jgi:digeranylgeranylglycerophospholipid reductase
MIKVDSDVVVVGAGPAGSRVAARLASEGYHVIILEKRTALGQPVCCTGIISARCLEQFNIAPELILRQYRGAVINTPLGNTIKIGRPEVQAVAIDRSNFDRRMAETAVSSGSTLYLGATVTGLTNSEGHVTVLYSREGSIHNISTRSVVIAAGLCPRLTGMLGLGKIRDAALGFQTEVATPQAVDVEVFFNKSLTPGFFAWMAPISETRAKVGLIAHRRGDGNLQGLLALLRSKGKIGIELDQASCRAIPLSTLPRTFADRILVVGDSAGQVKPTTGGGLYYALLCADIAGDTLAAALARNDLSSGFLKRYENAWRSAIGRDLMIGRLGRFMFQHLSDNHLNRIMLKARDSGMIERLEKDAGLSFDWHGKALLKAAGTLFASIF